MNSNTPNKNSQRQKPITSLTHSTANPVQIRCTIHACLVWHDHAMGWVHVGPCTERATDPCISLVHEEDVLIYDVSNVPISFPFKERLIYTQLSGMVTTCMRAGRPSDFLHTNEAVIMLGEQTRVRDVRLIFHNRFFTIQNRRVSCLVQKLLRTA